MALIDFKKFAKQQADALAGHVVSFQEVTFGVTKFGRLVGYYYDMAQLVLECAFAPVYSVDPRMSHIQLTAGFRSGAWNYTCVDVMLVTAPVRAKDPLFPHVCPRCGSDAFVLFRTVECSSSSCHNYARL